jgi:hypothetical protein
MREVESRIEEVEKVEKVEVVEFRERLLGLTPKDLG